MLPIRTMTNIYAFSLQLEMRNGCIAQSNDYDRRLSTVNEQQCSSVHTRYCNIQGTAVAQWLRCCATNRKVAGLIPDGVIGVFH